MRICFFLILTLLLASCTGAPIRRSQTGYNYNQAQNINKSFSTFIRKKVVLLPFYNESPFGKEDLAITATEELRRELAATRDYALDNETASLFGTSKQIYSGGGLRLNELSRKAKMSGVNLVVYGRIVEARVRQKADEIGIVRKTNAFAESLVEVRVYDVHTQKEVYAQKMNGNVSDSNYRFFMSERDVNLSYRQDLLRYTVKVAMRKFIPELHKIGSKLEWTGRVAKIIGNNIYINAGRESGLNVGDILKVVTEGQEIYDPETGALVGISKGEVKGTLEILDFFGPDGAVSILHSGGSVTEGDFVQLY